MSVYDLNYFVCTLVQSAAVQSGEKIMQFGQSIDASENTQGLIPRLLGQ